MYSNPPEASLSSVGVGTGPPNVEDDANPPEGCASILWKSADKAEDAAEAMRITADSLSEFGLVDEVLTEPLGAAHRNPSAMSDAISNAISRNLADLDRMDSEQLLAERQRRLAGFGQFKGG